MTEKFEVASAARVAQEIQGAEISHCELDGVDGLHLHFSDGRIFVVIGLPALGIALIQAERNIH